MKNLVITIGRQYGSGGREFGKMLAENLGIDFYDNEIVSLASENNNINPELSKIADEKATNSLLYSIVTGGGIRNMMNGYYEMPFNDKLFLAQADTIKKLAHEKSCVIVGRCSNYVLAEEKDLTKVNLFIFADMDYRINRIKNEYNLTEAQAKDKIVKTEKKRKSYYNYYSNGSWGNAADYDLCINLTHLTNDAAINMVKEFISGLER